MVSNISITNSEDDFLPIPTVPESKTQSLLQLSAFILYVVVKPSQLPSLLYAQFGYGVNFGDWVELTSNDM